MAHDDSISSSPKPSPLENQASTTSSQSQTTDSKKCISCQGLIPLTFFGARKELKSGRYNTCKGCTNEWHRNRWTKLHGREKPMEDKGPTRNVQAHNQTCLNVLVTLDSHIYGYDPISLRIYKVYWGFNQGLQMPSIAMFDLDGTLYREWISSGDGKFMDHIVEYLKIHNIRLELSEADMTLSKRLVYYFNV